MDENQHPKGALLFMLVYLLILVGLWLNVYLRLW
jgi:predicted nucleic acid-binding Zn ribbon protein